MPTRIVIKVIEEIVNSLIDLLSDKVGVIAESVLKKYSKVISYLLYLCILVSLFCFLLIFISIGASVYIGEKIGHPYYGYFIIAGFYFLLILFLLMIKSKPIDRMIWKRFKNLLNEPKIKDFN